MRGKVYKHNKNKIFSLLTINVLNGGWDRPKGLYSSMTKSKVVYALDRNEIFVKQLKKHASTFVFTQEEGNNHKRIENIFKKAGYFCILHSPIGKFDGVGLYAKKGFEDLVIECYSYEPRCECTTRRKWMIAKMSNGVTIANIHLCGGRSENLRFNKGSRAKEILSVIKSEKPDIILGDFNGDLSSRRTSQSIKGSYENFLEKKGRNTNQFKDWLAEPFPILKKEKYSVVKNEISTTPHYSVVDYIFYKKEAIQPLQKEAEILNFISQKVTDHNGVLVKMKVKNNG